MSSKADKEVEAMQKSLVALGGLEQDEQRRVLAWLANKLNLGNAASPFAGTGVKPTVAASMAIRDSGGNLTPKAFFVEKRPVTDVERVTCLAYYLTHSRGTAQFKTKELSELNKEAAQPKFSNTAVAVRNATNQNQFLSQAGGGKKQITARGEAMVEALPDQEKVKAALDAIPLRGYRKSKKSGRKPEKSPSARKT